LNRKSAKNSAFVIAAELKVHRLSPLLKGASHAKDEEVSPQCSWHLSIEARRGNRLGLAPAAGRPCGCSSLAVAQAHECGTMPPSYNLIEIDADEVHIVMRQELDRLSPAPNR
jgi:hypothetical protein